MILRHYALLLIAALALVLCMPASFSLAQAEEEEDEGDGEGEEEEEGPDISREDEDDVDSWSFEGEVESVIFGNKMNLCHPTSHLSSASLNHAKVPSLVVRAHAIPAYPRAWGPWLAMVGRHSDPPRMNRHRQRNN